VRTTSGGIVATALISSCENWRPRAAAICATSRQTIKPCQERRLKRCWDGQRRHRPRYRVAVAGLGEDAALDYGLGQLLDEKSTGMYKSLGHRYLLVGRVLANALCRLLDLSNER
jgi:hypothetical protein